MTNRYGISSTAQQNDGYFNIRAIVRGFIALWLTVVFAFGSAAAGVNSHQVKISGDSAGDPPAEATGLFNTEQEDHFSFRYKAGKNGDMGKFSEGTFELPYKSISRLVYGDTKHLRIGETIALTALAGVGGLLLLLSKSHTHYLSIYYMDSKDHEQVMSLEVGKDAIRPLMASLEVHTGKKVEYEAAGAPGAQSKH